MNFGRALSLLCERLASTALHLRTLALAQYPPCFPVTSAMRRWSFGKRCWVQGGERKSKWLESVYKEELTNDLFPLAIDNLFLPKEDARGNTQPGALVGDTLPVLGHPEPTPLTEAEQPQWLLYLARMAETFGRTRDTFRITKQLFKLKCDKRELISLAELRLLDSAYTNTINPIRNMYKTGIRIERRLREQTRIRVQIGRKAADDKAFTAAESSLLASKEIEQTAENMLTVRNKLMHSDVASLHVVDLWSNNPRPTCKLTHHSPFTVRRVSRSRRACPQHVLLVSYYFVSYMYCSHQLHSHAQLVDRIVATRKRNTNKADEVIENIIITKLQADSLRYLAEVGSVSAHSALLAWHSPTTNRLCIQLRVHAFSGALAQG